MQTQSEHALNIHRLSVYQAKQTAAQRRRAAIAERVSNYSKKLSLTVAQRTVAIRLALKQLEFGVSEETAYQNGAAAALTIARANANERIRSLRQRFSVILH